MCATVVLFSVVLYALASVAARQRVDQELQAANPATTFQAVAAPDGRLQAVRTGGFGQVPDRLPQPVRTGLWTLQPRSGDRIRLLVKQRSDGGFDVTGQHLGEVEGGADALLTYLLVTAFVTMLVGVLATWLAAGRALRPLRGMAATAEAVGRTRDLARRLPVLKPRDEVGRLAESFNGMLARLEAAQESQRRFVADASHELRTPLTSIRSNAGLLLREPPPPGVDAREAVVDIAAESERLSRLVDGLLTLARVDAGLELRREPVDLGRLAKAVADRAGLVASVEPAVVLGDPDALTQLAWILADNARRHGGGQGVMWVRRRPGGAATLLVSDQGPGLPAGEEERIFERFHQPDASRSRGGTGLGLAIARWIVERHGGRIQAWNDPAGGAVFRADF